MRVYLSAPLEMRPQMAKLSHALEKAGIDVVSRWVHDNKRDEDMTERELADCAALNLLDVLSSDAVVCFSSTKHKRGGRHVELGAALATKKHVVLVGDAEHVFHYHPRIAKVATEEQAIAELFRAMNHASE